LVVTPDFFRLFDIHLVRGRVFTDQDRAGAPRVAVVNEAMARFYFGSGDPIGRTLRFGTESTFASIVGVVPDIRHEGLRDAAPATVYTVMDQPAARLDGEDNFFLGRVTVAIRSPNDPRALAAAVQGTVRALSKEAVVWYVRTMQQQLDAALIRERLLARLSTGFGVLGLLLAFVGLYGVMSYRVARRTREIGVRLALGATRAHVVRQVFRETLWVAGVGIAIGLAAALVATKVVAAFLFGLSPRDPAMLASVALALLATAVVAALFPARRAAGVEPMRALRAE
jgi:predicted permease